MYTIDTVGGTEVAVYTGSALGSLSLVGAVSGHDADKSSTLQLTLNGGQTYAVQVGRPDWALSHVRVTPTPADDLFATPVDITGGSGKVTDRGAVQQPDEPVLGTDDPRAPSIWAVFTSPVTAPVDLATAGSYRGPELTVWSGDSLKALSLVVGPFLGGVARFDAVAGHTYRIQLRSLPTGFGRTTLSWSSGQPPTIASSFGAFNPHLRVGDTLSVPGERLGAVTSMTIGGIAAAFTLVSPTLIQAVVPRHATSGTVVLAYAGGSVTSPALVLYPSLDTISPTSGPVGTVVTVTGSNIPTFLTYAFLGGQTVKIDQVSYGRLTFTVPLAARSGQV